jgi:hypothetical protein
MFDLLNKKKKNILNRSSTLGIPLPHAEKVLTRPVDTPN